MKRRTFLDLVIGAAMIPALPVLRIMGRVLPIRYVEAVRSRFYPGPVTGSRKADIARPGKWAG